MQCVSPLGARAFYPHIPVYHPGRPLSLPPVPPRPHPGKHTHLQSFCLLQFEIRQLRAHLAQQDLDLAAEREAALQAPHVLSQPHSRYKVVEASTWAEETAAESIVEELRPSQGEPAVPQSPKDSSLTSFQVSAQRG